MRIDNNNPIDKAKDLTGTSHVDGKHKRGIGRRHSDTETDTSANVNLSRRSKDAARAEKIAKETPDVNEEKIAKLKAAIESGIYKVDSKAIADKLVDEHLAGMV